MTAKVPTELVIFLILLAPTNGCRLAGAENRFHVRLRLTRFQVTASHCGLLLPISMRLQIPETPIPRNSAFTFFAADSAGFIRWQHPIITSVQLQLGVFPMQILLAISRYWYILQS